MKYFSLALATVVAAAENGENSGDNWDRTINGNLYTQTGLYLRTYAPQMLSEFLDSDGNKVDAVLGHGCHCAKLDSTNPFAEHLGGSTPVDALDEICRDWLRARNCNDNLVGGSCEADRESMRTGAYTMDIVSNNYPISNCGFTTTDCEADTCDIDLVYLKAINQYMADNPGHSANVVNGSGTCTLAPLDKRERRCEGDAPNVYPKRMSDLEQLMTRIDWEDDKNADDVIFYNAGGRKLNDSKEYIDIFVFNQLITFNWDNVKSFTFETTEAFNPYYVGWVERARVDNFAPGGTDTLGDDTKGGVKTTGIFSGDGTIRVLDGLELPANPAASFFDEGSTVTCTRNGDNFEYYINGALINTVSSAGWAAAYPAIDVSSRMHVRMIDVTYEDAESDPVDIWN
jgi:hypothetical protein